MLFIQEPEGRKIFFRAWFSFIFHELVCFDTRIFLRQQEFRRKMTRKVGVVEECLWFRRNQ